MGLNRLLHQHQVALMRADAAGSALSASTNRRLAFGYARRIETLVQPDRQAHRPLVPTS